MKVSYTVRSIPIALVILCLTLIAIPFIIEWYADTYYIGVANIGKDLEADELSSLWMFIAEIAVIVSFIYCLIAAIIMKSKQAIVSLLILAIPSGFLVWTYINMKIIEFYIMQ
jgi:hypothetical protein